MVATNIITYDGIVQMDLTMMIARKSSIKIMSVVLHKYSSTVLYRVIFIYLCSVSEPNTCEL